MKIATTLTALALIGMLSAPAQASIENAGTTAGNFLAVGAGASVLGMGGSGLALSSGVTSAAWNPAALARLDQIEFAVSHAGLPDQTSQEWMAVGGRFGSTATHWAVSGLYHGQGTFEGRDASGAATGGFGASDMALGASVAQGIGPFFSAGLGVKYVSEVLDATSGSGLTFDAGLMAHSGPASLAVAARDFGGRMNYSGASYPFPSSYGIGGALELPTGLRLALDANFPHAYYHDVRAGIEWRWKGLLALRAGYRKEQRAPAEERLTGPTFGFGGGMGSMWLDYAYIVPGQGAGEHRIGLVLKPGLLRQVMRPLSDNASPSPAVAEATGVSTPVATGTTPPVAAPADPIASVAPSTPPSDPPTPPSDPEPAPIVVEAPPTLPTDVATASDLDVSGAAPAPRPVVAAPASTPALAKVKSPKMSLPVPAAIEPAPVAAVAPAPVAAPKKNVVALASTAPMLAPAPTPASGGTSLVVQRPTKVKVRSGETLYSIAKAWGVSVPSLMMENNLVNEKVSAGQELRLPKK